VAGHCFADYFRPFFQAHGKNSTSQTPLACQSMIDYLGYEYHFPVESIVIEAWPQLILCGPCVNLAASMVLRPPPAHHLVAGNRGGTRESV
jgi:hypothetical protein